MKDGWQKKQLGELAELKGRIGWRGLTAKEYTRSGPLFLSVHSLNYGDYVDFRDAFHISEDRYAESPEIMLRKDDVLICKDGAGIGKLGIVGDLPDRATINSSLLLIRSGIDVLPKFLYRCLCSPYFQEIVNSRLNGATTPHLYQRDITEFPVVLPPLPEQQRIVAVLDEAFDGLATAKANAEKNLQNARALFESHLQSVFTRRGKGWVEKSLSELCDVTHGYSFEGAEFSDSVPEGNPLVLTPGNFTEDGKLLFNEKNTKRLSGRPPEAFRFDIGDLVVVMTDLSSKMKILGKPAFVETDNVLHNQRIGRVIFSSNTIEKRFVFYFMMSESFLKNIKNSATGTMVKHTAPKRILMNVIPFPPDKNQQLAIINKLDNLSAETNRLKSFYQQKLAALEALKKSLLHEAFTGELTKVSSQQVMVTPLLPLLPPISNFTPIELHAGILVMGYQAWEQANKQWNFGHVMAEKFAHMTEAMAGLDLGRKPVQDHFGPDDFPHFHKVEHRARMANYFTFKDGKRGKVFVKGRRFESLATKTRTALGDLSQKVDAVIKLMLPLDMQQAEVFATVYAAWNNLLMDNQTPTDEQIVLAARENWHPDKLKMEREKFFKTIDWIRKKNISPQGKGKRVLPRAG
jgi:type I restriction enzyme S subunit